MSSTVREIELPKAKRRRLRLEERDIRFGRLLMIPSLVIPVVLLLVFLAGIYVTSQYWRLTTGNGGFAGLSNYETALTDVHFWVSFRATMEFTVINVSTELVLATIMALALNESLHGLRIYRSLLILPLMTPPVVGALVWKVLYRSGTGGFFNFLLWRAGLPQQGFIGTADQAILSLVVIDIWLNMPFIATILLAGLQGMPQEPIESARVDGANPWQVFWHVKLPLLVPFYIVALFLRVIDSLNIFDTIYGTTSGGPGEATRVVAQNGYENAFPFFNLSFGLTEFILLWLLCMVVGSLLYRWVKRSTQDQQA